MGKHSDHDKRKDQRDDKDERDDDKRKGRDDDRNERRDRDDDRDDRSKRDDDRDNKKDDREDRKEKKDDDKGRDEERSSERDDRDDRGRGDDDDHGSQRDDGGARGRAGHAHSDDDVVGTDHFDVIATGKGDDRIEGGGGHDILIGGSGTDTAVYQGSVLDYAWAGWGNVGVIQDRNLENGNEGTDFLVGIEKLEFSDFTYEMGKNNGALVQAEDTATDEDTGIDLSFKALDFDCGEVSVESVTVSGGGTISLADGSTQIRAGMGHGAEFGLRFEPGDAYQHLNEGESVIETVTVVVSDGQGAYTTKTFKITIEGRNDDEPVVVQPLDATVAYDADPATQEDGVTELTGQISSTGGVDGAEKSYSVVSGGVLGALTVAADGSFAYALDNGSDAVQALADGETAIETFEIEVTDGEGNVDVVTVELTVSGTNDAPTIASVGAPATATEAAPSVSGQVSAADIDNGDVLSYAVEGDGQGSYGSILMNAETGAWEFTADPEAQAFKALGAGETAVQQFVVEVSDGKGGTTTDIIAIEIQGTNDGPVIDGVSYLNDAVVEDGVATASGVIEASDADAGDSLAFAAEAPQGSYGALAVDPATGEWTYTMDNAAAQSLGAGQVATESFTVSVTDSQGGVATSTVTVTVTGTNDAPIISSTGTPAAPASDAAPTLSGSVAASDVDEGDVLAYGIDGPAAGEYGSLVIDAATGEWTFTVDPNAPAVQALGASEIGTQSFMISVSDGNGGTVAKELVVEVAGSNSAPTLTAVSQDVSELVEDGVIIATGKVQGSDADAGDSLAYAAQGGSYGTPTVDAEGNWSYALDNASQAIQSLGAGESLTESFEITVTDSQGATDTVTIELTVTGTNDAPVVSSAGAPVATNEAQPSTTGQVVASDVDANDVLAYAVQDATNDYGTFTVDAATGAYEFVLNPNAPAVQALGSGDQATQDFVVEVSDGKGGVTPATVTVTIEGSNAAPVIDSVMKSGDAVEDTVTQITGTVQASDADAGDTLTYAISSNGTHGAAAIDATGAWTYDLANASPAVQALGAGETLTESFVVSVTDASGAEVTEVVELTITGTNDAPVVENAGAGAVSEAVQSVTGQIVASDVDTNDTLTFQTVDGSDYGSFAVDPTSGEWTFTLNPDAPAVKALGAGDQVIEELTVTVSDGQGGTTTATVPVTITGTNGAPVIEASTRDAGPSLVEDGASIATGQVVASDPDANDVLDFAVKGGGQGGYGALSVGSDGRWTYSVDQASSAVQALAAGQVVTEQFEIEVTDQSGETVSTIVEIQVTGTNDAPIASSASPATPATAETTTLTGQVVASDVDTGDVLSYATNGSGVGTYGNFAVDAATGAWSFELDANSPAVQALGAGEQATEDFVVEVSDGQGGMTPTTITIAVEGGNDAPVVTQVTYGNSATIESLYVDAYGQVHARDQDGDAITFSIENPVSQYGTYSIDAATGEWTFVLDNESLAVQSLAEGEVINHSATVVVTDALGASTSEVISITILGDNDAPIIEAVTYASGSIATETASSLTGSVVATDVDARDVLTYMVWGQGMGSYGSLSIDETGNWTYTGDAAAMASLGANDTYTEVFTVSASDAYGAVTTEVRIDVQGSNSDPVISEVYYYDTSITEDGPATEASGYIVASDPDMSDTLTMSVIGDGLGNYGNLTMSDSGSWWAYRVDHSSAAIQSLGAGEVATDEFFFQVSDGNGGVVSERIAVEVIGVNDDPTIQEVVYNSGGQLSEDDVLEAAGTISVSDVDLRDTFVFTVENGGAGTYGSLAVAPDGAFLYRLNNDSAAVQDLTGGQVVSDSFSVEISDGNGGTVTTQLSFDVTGADDRPLYVLNVEGMYAGGKSKLPAGYGGFDWDANTGIVQGINYGGGWTKGTTSGKNAIFDMNGAGMSFTRGGDVFDFEKVNLAAANELAATAVITGLLNGQIVGVQEVAITRTASTEVFLDDSIFDFVDEVRIDGAGPVVMDDWGFYL